jgi:hypothetical protein
MDGSLLLLKTARNSEVQTTWTHQDVNIRTPLSVTSGAGIAQSVQRLAMGWTVRGSNTGGGEILHTRPDRPWGPPNLLYNGYRFSFPGLKRPGRGIGHPPPSRVGVKERVELYLYSPSGPSWPVLG